MANAVSFERNRLAETEENAKRILRLEKIVGKGNFNRYEAERECPDEATLHRLNFLIEATDDCRLRFAVGVKTECENYRLAIKIDGATAFDGALSGNAEASFLAPLGKGERTISAELSAQVAFTAKSFSISTEGCVDYPETEYFLTVLNEETQSVIAFARAGELLVKRYIGGDLQTKIRIGEIKSGVVCKLADFYAAVFVNADGDLKCNLYDSDFAYVKGCTLDSSVASAAAISGNPATVIAVKGNCVYKYKIDDDLNLVTTATSWNAWRVFCDPSILNYFVATDHSGNGKIIRNI